MNKFIEYKNDLLGEKYYKIKHESGLSVYVFPKDRVTSCAIFATEYGSVDNCFYSKEEGKYIKVPEGIAHFLEHKMFDNEDGTNVDEVFSKLSADPNAYTAWEETGYFFTCSENFYESLALLMRFVLKPYFTSESIEKEQGIIGQEIAMCDDDPYDCCYMNMVRGIYERNPARLDIAGSEESISKITADLLYKCHKTFYNPSNMVLIASGNIDPDKVIEIVDLALKEADCDREPCLERKYPKERKSVFKKKTTSKMQVERPMFCIGFKDSDAPLDNSERRRRQIIAELVIGMIFASSGKLYSNLFKRGIMTTPFNYGAEYGKTYSFCYTAGECDDPDLMYENIIKYIEDLKKNGIDEIEFERRRKIMYASDIKIYDSTWDISNALFDNAFWDIDIFSDSETVKQVTLEEANDFLKEVFKKDRMTISVIEKGN